MGSPVLLGMLGSVSEMTSGNSSVSCFTRSSQDTFRAFALGGACGKFGEMTLNLIRSCQLISMSSATTLDMRALISATALSFFAVRLALPRTFIFSPFAATMIVSSFSRTRP